VCRSRRNPLITWMPFKERVNGQDICTTFNACSAKAHAQEQISQPPFCGAFIPEKSCKEDFARADREHRQD